ncbi:VWA domain-containing protein [Dysosmobacter sp.]|uniref:VWA domain-containing protein n=1 Tax=Dysosmobacter sp. TaxID=2591382 RepID=UPI002A904826|nr:VWA domain-containing protein [Dysosmobacter sp.]MDY3282591.1 VWA domain-containing protein [Dysosmobacter sp.]
MFLELFYGLRAAGIPASPEEWLTLMAGLEAGLHGSTFSGFYWLCRMTLVKDESKYDLFDQVFQEVFRRMADPAGREELNRELLEWLKRPKRTADFSTLAEGNGMSREEVRETFAQRLREQKQEHNGGRVWIGTGGVTAFGSGGQRPGGIRVGGRSEYRSAWQQAGARNYRDWRTDVTLEPRQFQLALRTLRQYARDSDLAETELDVDATIRSTCSQGGMLRVEYRRPRKNQVKLLLLIDSGGSMEPYSQLCGMLFRAVSKDSRFKDLKIYYFHNCVYSEVYTTPTLDRRTAVKTQWILQNLPPDYRVILVGDGEMDLDELITPGISLSGLERLLQLKERYPRLVWFYPQTPPEEGGYLAQSFDTLRRHLPMYRLSVEGLNQGMRKLMDIHRR